MGNKKKATCFVCHPGVVRPIMFLFLVHALIVSLSDHGYHCPRCLPAFAGHARRTLTGMQACRQPCWCACKYRVFSGIILWLNIVAHRIGMLTDRYPKRHQNYVIIFVDSETTKLKQYFWWEYVAILAPWRRLAEWPCGRCGADR